VIAVARSVGLCLIASSDHRRQVAVVGTGAMTARFGADANLLASARGSDRSPDREGGVAPKHQEIKCSEN